MAARSIALRPEHYWRVDEGHSGAAVVIRAAHHSGGLFFNNAGEHAPSLSPYPINLEHEVHPKTMLTGSWPPRKRLSVAGISFAIIIIFTTILNLHYRSSDTVVKLQLPSFNKGNDPTKQETCTQIPFPSSSPFPSSCQGHMESAS